MSIQPADIKISIWCVWELLGANLTYSVECSLHSWMYAGFVGDSFASFSGFGKIGSLAGVWISLCSVCACEFDIGIESSFLTVLCKDDFDQAASLPGTRFRVTNHRSHKTKYCSLFSFKFSWSCQKSHSQKENWWKPWKDCLYTLKITYLLHLVYLICLS